MTPTKNGNSDQKWLWKNSYKNAGTKSGDYWQEGAADKT